MDQILVRKYFLRQHPLDAGSCSPTFAGASVAAMTTGLGWAFFHAGLRVEAIGLERVEGEYKY